MRRQIVLFGCGGHAKVVLEALLAAEPDAEVAILDDGPGAGQRSLLGRPVAGPRQWLETNWPGAPVALGIGNNRARYDLIQWLKAAARPLLTVVHPAATVSPSAVLGGGTFLAAGAIINAEARLGEGVILNTGASVDHDCRIGAAAHIAPGARLCGNVEVGERSLVGTATAVIPGIRIGADVTVGAGSAVVRDVEDGARVAGCPTRPVGGAR